MYNRNQSSNPAGYQRSITMAISSNQVTSLLSNLKGTTFAKIEYSTVVATSAANKALKIVKHSTANIQLFNGIKDYKAVYLAAVKRSAAKIESNDNANVESFELTPTWYNHSDCFSLVSHNKTGSAYLFAIYNKSSSYYEIDGVKASKQAVAAYLTPSAAKALLDDSGITYNVKNDVSHKVIVRTVSLDNIHSIKAMGDTIA
jgi:hypothetical protein